MTEQRSEAKSLEAPIPPEMRAKVPDLIEELTAIAEDPQVLLRAEELHKKISHLSVEDLLTPINALVTA